jgi:hypothetical protein
MVRYLSIDNKHPKIDFARKCSFSYLYILFIVELKVLFNCASALFVGLYHWTYM